MKPTDYPTPNGHGFGTALTFMRAGRKVQRQCWNGNYTLWLVEEPGIVPEFCLLIKYTGQIRRIRSINADDICARDWIILHDTTVTPRKNHLPEPPM